MAGVAPPVFGTVGEGGPATEAALNNAEDVAVAPNGDIFLSDGYASDHIFKYDKSGRYLMHFGTKGNGLKEFSTAHGMTLFRFERGLIQEEWSVFNMYSIMKQLGLLPPQG